MVGTIERERGEKSEEGGAPPESADFDIDISLTRQGVFRYHAW